MDDDVLLRARALMQAMNAMTMEQNVSVERATRSMTLLGGGDQSSTSPTKSSPLKKPSRLPKLKVDDDSVSKDISLNAGFIDGNNGGQICRGAAISGSTLLTTFADLRNFVKRGEQIIVGGTPYTIAVSGELTANRIELAEDFKGATNLDVAITLAHPVKQKKVLRKASPKPVAAGLLMNAVQGLDAITKLVSSGPLIPDDSHQSKQSTSKLPKKVAKKKTDKPVLSSRNDDGHDFSVKLHSPDTGMHYGSSRNPFDNKYRSDSVEMNASTLPTLSSLANTSINILEAYQQSNPGDNIVNFGAIHQADETHKKRSKIIARMVKQRKEKVQQEEQHKHQEVEIIEKRKEASEIKVAMLRDKTAQRVAKLKEEKVFKEQQDIEQQRYAEQERRERAAMIASEEAQERLRLMQQQTIARMRRRNQEVRKKEQEELQAKEHMLARLAREKGCLVPTSNIIAGNPDGSTVLPDGVDGIGSYSSVPRGSKQRSKARNFVAQLAQNSLLVRNNSEQVGGEEGGGDNDGDYGVDSMGAFVFEKRVSVSEGGTVKKGNRNNKKGQPAAAATAVPNLQENSSMRGGAISDSIEFEGRNIQQAPATGKLPTLFPSISTKAGYDKAVTQLVNGSEEDEKDDWSDDSGPNDDGNNISPNERINKQFNNYDNMISGNGIDDDKPRRRRAPNRQSKVINTQSLPLRQQRQQRQGRQQNDRQGDDDDNMSVVSELSCGTAREKENLVEVDVANKGKIGGDKCLVPHRPPRAPQGQLPTQIPVGGATHRLNRPDVLQANTIVDNTLISQSTKATSSSSQVWKKLKPIPIAPYIPV
jgi:hypothetical protein